MGSIREKYIHIYFHPLSAKRFVEPLVDELLRFGIKSEVWIEDIAEAKQFTQLLKVPYRFVSSKLTGSPIETVKIFSGLFVELLREKPLVVEAHSTRGSFIPLIAAYFTGVPVRIYHNQGVPYLGYRGILRFLLFALEWLNCRFATHVLTVSDGMLGALSKAAPINKQPVKITPGSACGLDSSEYSSPSQELKFAERKAFGIGASDLVFLYVGRPEVRKGFEITLKGFASCFKDRSDVHLLIVGADKADVKKYLKQVAPNIRALGYLSNLSSIYRSSDAVVLPSLHEGFGYALLEGAAHGCSLIASKIPGPDEIVKDGENGFLIPPGDIVGLMNTMKWIDLNRDILLGMSKKSYLIAKEFERKIFLKNYMKWIESVMSVGMHVS